MSDFVENLVSVIVPTHNRGQRLKTAVDSILGQSYQDIEVIIVANGCTDESTKIAQNLQKEYPKKIKLLEFVEKLGGAKARNIGLDAAKGEYIGFLDDDDFWHKNKLTSQISLLKQDKYAIISSNFIYVYGENQQRQSRQNRDKIINLADLFYENMLGGYSFCLTKKSYIGSSRIDENLDAMQDWDLWLKILQNTKKPGFIDKNRLVYFKIDGVRISNNYKKVANAQKLFLKLWQDLFGKNATNYHKMRTKCLVIKERKNWKYLHYLSHLWWIFKAILASPHRTNPRFYLHYLALPLIDIDKLRIKLWSGKQ